MAIYHLRAKVVKRSAGHSAVAAAAYRSGSQIGDDRTGLTHDYSRKSAVDYSQILLPDSAPDWMANRGQLWNAVEASEKRRDAQLAREIEISLPVELDRPAQIAAATRFAGELVSQGMCADLNFHHLDGENPHAHIMLTLREVDPTQPQGFGPKNRDWNRTPLLEQWRARWSDVANEALATHGHAARIDHRTLEAQGIERLPTVHLGKHATARLRGQSERFLNPDLTPQQREKSRHTPTPGAAWQERISERVTDRIREIATEAKAAADHLYDAGSVERRSFLGEVRDTLDLDRIHAQARAQASPAPVSPADHPQLANLDREIDAARREALNEAKGEARAVARRVYETVDFGTWNRACNGYGLPLVETIRVRSGTERARGFQANLEELDGLRGEIRVQEGAGTALKRAQADLSRYRRTHPFKTLAHALGGLTGRSRALRPLQPIEKLKRAVERASDTAAQAPDRLANLKARETACSDRIERERATFAVDHERHERVFTEFPDEARGAEFEANLESQRERQAEEARQAREQQRLDAERQRPVTPKPRPTPGPDQGPSGPIR